jgi:hypothetical protein
MTKYEKITKHGTGWADQPSLFFIEKRPAISGNFGGSDHTIWSIQSAGIPLYANGQKEPGFHSNSGTVRGLYSKVGSNPYQTSKSHCFIDGSIDQHGGKNGVGRVFIKTRPCRKKRDELNYPVLMTGLVSKSSPRFTVSLFLVLNLITS